MEQVASIGELLLDIIQVPQSERSDKVYSIFSPGGSAANTAVGLARLGVRAKFIGVVGDDYIGHFLLDYIKRSGVLIDQVKVKNFRTTVAIVILKEGGEREFVIYRKPFVETADSMLDLKDIDVNEIVRENDIILTTGVALSQEPSRSTVLRVIEESHKNDKITILDPNIRLDIWSSKEEMIHILLSSLRSFDAFLGSIEEAQMLTSLSDPEEIADHLISKYGLDLVAIKMGKKGAYVKTSGKEEALVPSFNVKVIDTTGAGDAWNAGFIYSYYVKKDKLEESVKFANAVAALKCMDYGAMYPLPTLNQVKKFLLENK
ncbi:MAG: sugar kinase [Sulfolobaceae archaeon]|nr:sugar kinase [Sulfolobaceae archaeon]